MGRWLAVGGVLLIALAWFGFQRWIDGRCYAAHMSGGRWTPQGVFCYQNLGDGRSDFYYRLDDLEAATPVPTFAPPLDEESG